MFDHRIYFKGNPWPEGHPIKEFEWGVELRGDRVWCHMHLRSADYYAERNINEEIKDFESDWASPHGWNNYNSCILSSTYWGHSGFDLCSIDDFTPEKLDGMTVSFDPKPKDVADHYDLAFGIYLLGHDACGKHNLTFTRIAQTEGFNIGWSGKIARAYVGENNFVYDFKAKIADVALPTLKTLPL